ncbi:MAG: hypothetical protein RL693_2622, partial [Verrucomicrobiota bacterium]
MPAEPIDSRVARARSAKRYWLWGIVGFAVVAWLAFWWVSSQRNSVTLPDGSIFYCAKVLEGTRVNDTEFEPDVYAYSEDAMMTTTDRIFSYAQNLIRHGLLSSGEMEFFQPAPQIMMLGGNQNSSSSVDDQVILDDGFGNDQFLRPLGRRIHPEMSPLNHRALPQGSPAWKIKFQDDQHQTLGVFTVPNRSFTPAPLFDGKSPPLEARSSKNVLRLLSATSMVSPTKERDVMLAFDTSACRALLPCHVIGVRITDSRGNTVFLNDAPVSAGETILVKSRMSANLNEDIDRQGKRTEEWCAQSGDWNIKIALCRGRSASLASEEVAIFEDIISTGYLAGPAKRTLRGRDITLAHFLPDKGSLFAPELDWTDCHLQWELDQKGPLLWPILIKTIGHTREGALVEIDPSKSKNESGSAEYQLKRKRYSSSGHS